MYCTLPVPSVIGSGEPLMLETLRSTLAANAARGKTETSAVAMTTTRSNVLDMTLSPCVRAWPTAYRQRGLRGC